MTTTMLRQYKFNDYPFISTNKNDIEEFDRIEVQYFAECIADFISDCQTPMTVGLQGDWGTGKTSLMNMIKCNLSDRKSLKIDINTWHYSMFRQDEYLGIIIVQSLVEELANEIAKKDPEVSNSLKETSNKIGGVLQKALSVGKSIQFGIPGGGVSINDIQEALKTVDDSLQVENLSAIMLKFKDEFTELVGKYLTKNKERIIFFVDDLDRIRPIKAVEVLETLKNFMDVEGCVFVLAVDYEIVQLGIAEKFGTDIQQTSGKSFFDKIIQLPFTMPTCSYNIERYLSDLLQDSKFYNYKLDTNPEDSAFFVNITEATVGRNPRSIKRAVNYASLLERIRAKNVAGKGQRKGAETAKLLYSIVCMQIAWPELFEYFVLNPSPETIEHLEDWDFLDSLPNAKKLFLRVQNVDEVKDNISTYFDTLYDLLDKDNSGYISDEQLKPLLDVLQLVKLTSEKIIVQSENPLKTFRNKVINNAGTNKQYVKFFDQVFLKSLWASVEEYAYKKAGERYFTMVCNRRQVGSLVSLKSYPIMIRIKEHRDNILKQLQEDPDYEIYEKVLKGSESIATMSGIGDTAIDCTELISLNDEEKSKDILNKVSQIFKSINNI